MELTSFLLGFCLALAIAGWRIKRIKLEHARTLIGIYYGYGAPDEYGCVGWYPDNRNGSPFTDPDSPWGEPGGIIKLAKHPEPWAKPPPGRIIASAPTTPPPPKPKR